MSTPIALPDMAIAEAQQIGRLCADLEAGYPPTNPYALIRAILTLLRSDDRDDRDLIPSIFRWGSNHS